VDLFVVRGTRMVRRDGVPISGFGPRVFRFGAFELDESRFELRRGGRVVRISRRAFDVLVFLAENASRIVTKRELIDGPYHGATVTNSALSRTMRLARRALGDDSKAPALILTVRSEGYCFVPPAPSRAAKDPLRLP
jgi:DNA-binding winged helix-turn-helix (wHTH) protein